MTDGERLPVEDALPELRAALADPGVAVLTAEPGAGKTTVVPLRLLDEPWASGDGRIVVLEPRRVATRAAARRMAWTLGEDVGRTVGYRTRDDRRVSNATRVEVVTEGILTRRLQTDPELRGTALVVFDEFHERNLQADLGLALALDVRRSIRPDLRILVMSATLEVERVAKLLGGAPVVRSVGRSHRVDVRWVPRTKNDRLEQATAATVRRALRENDEGDVLVFLPGAAEIRRTAELLDDAAAEVHTLHGSMAAAEQDAALAPDPSGRRKVVLSTDIAESSLTVEGVTVVVDAGLARVPRFDVGTSMTRLTTIASSKASADQRAGRAGRTRPGVAYRLWSKVEHAARRPHADPEIAQVDLAGLVLELAAWGVTDPSSLPFLDAPPRRAIDEGRALLRSLRAIDDDGRITDTGRDMAGMPLHPRLAHMVSESIVRGGGTAMLACCVAALLEDRDVMRGRPDEVPADLGLRLALLDDPSRSHPAADGRALRTVRQRAVDLAGRTGVSPDEPLAYDDAGAVLALAYPDRVGGRRDGSSPGRFKLRSGSGAWVSTADSIASSSFVVAADLDGNRKDARIRIGAPIDGATILELFADEITEHTATVWDRERDDIVTRAERTLGSLRLGVVERRPARSAATERVVRERLKTTRVAALSWSTAATRLRERLAFVHAHADGDADGSWPDMSDAALLKTMDDWLGPDLAAVTSRANLEAIDVARALKRLIPMGRHGELDRLAPGHVRLPSGRTVTVDYLDGTPSIAVKVQDAFGLRETPTAADGRVAIVVHLLSPAGRPVQITSDIAGFWRGSWHDVRKELAGRYPKHAWPADPTGTNGA